MRSAEDLQKIEKAKEESCRSERKQSTLVLQGDRREFFRFAFGKLAEYDTIGKGAMQISLLSEELAAIEETSRPPRRSFGQPAGRRKGLYGLAN